MTATRDRDDGGTTLTDQFGAIDIYLFDQLLRNRITPDMTVLDAGCGNGRNLVYLLQQGCRTYGVDASVRAVAATRELASRLSPSTPPDRFRTESLDAMSFEDNYFHAVICSAVLHFADGPDHFDRMVDELWRVLAPGGFLFTRLASSIGIEDRVVALGSGRYRLPDGSDRYLVEEAQLLEKTDSLGGRLADPLKTTNVQGQRCMTTWCLWKGFPTRRPSGGVASSVTARLAAPSSRLARRAPRQKTPGDLNRLGFRRDPPRARSPPAAATASGSSPTVRGPRCTLPPPAPGSATHASGAAMLTPTYTERDRP